MCLTNSNSVISKKFNSFVKDFNYRNEIDLDEIIVLSKKFKQTNINNIPVSWVLSIDCLLKNLYERNCIPLSVSQNYGFLVIEFEKIPSQEILGIVRYTEEEVYAFDDDLYKELEL